MVWWQGVLAWVVVIFVITVAWYVACILAPKHQARVLRRQEKRTHKRATVDRTSG